MVRSLRPSPTVTEIGDAFELLETNAIYWEGDWTDNQDVTITVKATLADGEETVISGTRKIKGRLLEPGLLPDGNFATRGDDVLMLKMMLQRLGFSETSLLGVLGSIGHLFDAYDAPGNTVDCSGLTIQDLFHTFAAAVKRFQFVDQIPQDCSVGNQTLGQLKLHWNDYTTALQRFPTRPVIKNNTGRDTGLFRSWLDTASQELQKTYTLAHHKTVTGITDDMAANESYIELLRSWINRESWADGQWGSVGKSFRITLGAGDEFGSIGFSQILNKWKFGLGTKLGELATQNLYAPDDAIRSLAVFSNIDGNGFSQAFVSQTFRVNLPISTASFPHLESNNAGGDSYVDDIKDQFSKGIFAYNAGTRSQLRTFVWPEILRLYNNPFSPPSQTEIDQCIANPDCDLVRDTAGIIVNTTSRPIAAGTEYSLKVQGPRDRKKPEQIIEAIGADILLKSFKWVDVYAIAAGSDGTCDSVLSGDDIASSDSSDGANRICVCVGEDKILQTTQSDDDTFLTFTVDFSESDWLGRKSWKGVRDTIFQAQACPVAIEP